MTVSRGVGRYECSACRRIFGGREAFRQAHFGRCLPARDLRRRGFHQREDGTWTRTYDPALPRQLRLFRVGRPARTLRRSAGVTVDRTWDRFLATPRGRAWGVAA